MLPFLIISLQYTQAVLHSIQNADGTVSIIQVDPSNQIITLPDGTTAQVQGIATVSHLNPRTHAIQNRISVHLLSKLNFCVFFFIFRFILVADTG